MTLLAASAAGKTWSSIFIASSAAVVEGGASADLRSKRYKDFGGAEKCWNVVENAEESDLIWRCADGDCDGDNNDYENDDDDQVEMCDSGVSQNSSRW